VSNSFIPAWLPVGLIDGGSYTYPSGVSLLGPNTIQLAGGTAAAPSLRFTGASANTGFYLYADDSIGVSVNGVYSTKFDSTGIITTSNLALTGASAMIINATLGSLYFQNGGQTFGNVITTGFNTGYAYNINIGYGDLYKIGWVQQVVDSPSGAAFADTAIDLPNNSMIEAVLCRINTVIPGGKVLQDVGTPAATQRFYSGGASGAQGTQIYGMAHLDPAALSPGPVQAATAKVRLTFDGDPGATTGKIRVLVYYRRFTAPTS